MLQLVALCLCIALCSQAASNLRTNTRLLLLLLFLLLVLVVFLLLSWLLLLLLLLLLVLLLLFVLVVVDSMGYIVCILIACHATSEIRSVPLRFLFWLSLSTAKTTVKQAANDKKRKLIEGKNYWNQP
jgi:hypothetical protein